ncbi:MAG: AraC family transcriptional regulator [Mesorhizobium sp.]
MKADAGSHSAVPLASHVLFQSDDLDCARERVAQKFCRHRLDIVGSRPSFRAAHHHAPGDMISLNYISYGADVEIDPGELGDFYLIQMPVTGAATVRNGTKEFLTDRSTASILNADLATRMRWWEGCAQILVQVRKAPFLAFAERVLDRPLPGPLQFDPLIDFSRPEMLAWRAFANSLFHAADTAGPELGKLQAAFNEQRLMELFLRVQPSNMSIFMENRSDSVLPRHMKRADEYIRAHAADAVTLTDICDAAGVTPRTLQLGYKAMFGMSPMHALQGERLKRVHFELVSGQAHSVADTALKWGFSHLGRFSGDYRDMFGETPRETLARSRG